MTAKSSAPRSSPPEIDLAPDAQDDLQALIEEARQRARHRRRRFGIALALAVVIIAGGYEVLMQPFGMHRRSVPRLRVSQVAPIRGSGCENGGQALSELAFSNVADGWVLAGPSDATAGRLEVLGTRDAGSSWSCEWASSWSPGQVVATDARHAWVLGWGAKGCRAQLSSECESAIGGTRDGRHWSLLAVIHQTVTQLAFSSSSFGMAAVHDGNCPEPAGMPPSRCPGQILATSDGGRHWRSVLRMREPIIGVATYRGEFWAVEARLGVTGYKRGRPGLTVLASTDQGRSWKATGRLSLDTAGLRTRVDLMPGPGGRLWLSVLDQDSCAMHGCGTDGVWFSRDAGQTWRAATPDDRMDPRPPGCGIAGQVTLARDPTSRVWASYGEPVATCERPATALFDLDSRTGEPSSGRWTVAHRWPAFSPLALAWPGSTSGYALGATGLTRTTDGGRSWNQVLPAPSPTGALDAVSATTAYAAQDATDQGAMLGTTDGGLHWRVLGSLPGELESLDFISPSDGVAVGVSWDTATNLPQWQVYGTDSGGRSWVLRARLDLRGGGQVSGVWMANSRRGLILTTASFAYPQVNGGGSTPAALLRTSDGGRTWTRVGRPPLGSTDVFDGATFTYTGHGRWAGWFLTGSGLQATTDTDAHWHLLRRRPPLSLIAAPPFIGIERITSNFGIGWTSDNGRTNLWRTLDAGNHWSRVSLPPRLRSTPSPGQPAVQVSFTNPRIGWLVADGIIWRTTNGGRSWMSSEPSASVP